MKKEKNNSEYDGPFAGRVIDLLKSPVFCVLSKNARRMLDRIEIELADHYGRDNGNLPITHRDFVKFGIHDHAVAPASREIVALGLAKIKRGRAGNAEFRRASLHGLTYRRITKDAPPTDEWRQIKTVKEAKKIAAEARKAPSKNQWKRPRKIRRKAGSKNIIPLAETTSEVAGGNHQRSLTGGNHQHCFPFIRGRCEP
jgi:hypothetical protein